MPIVIRRNCAAGRSSWLTVSSASSTVSSMCVGLNPQAWSTAVAHVALAASPTILSRVSSTATTALMTRIICISSTRGSSRQAQGVGHNCQTWIDAARGPLTRFCWKREGALPIARRFLRPRRLRADAGKRSGRVAFSSPVRAPVRQ